MYTVLLKKYQAIPRNLLRKMCTFLRLYDIVNDIKGNVDPDIEDLSFLGDS